MSSQIPDHVRTDRMVDLDRYFAGEQPRQRMQAAHLAEPVRSAAAHRAAPFHQPLSRPVGVRKLEHSVRQLAGELIDEVIGRGHGECLRELAQRFLYSAAETGQPARSKAFGCNQPATQLPSCG